MTRFRPERISAGMDEGFLDATSLAEYLVARGIPFRQAHQIVGGLVAQAERGGASLSALPLVQMQQACEKIGRDVYEYLGAENVVRRYSPDGAAGPRQLQEQLKFWEKKLSKNA